jgi:hypothetical protein
MFALIPPGAETMADAQVQWTIERLFGRVAAASR